MPPNAPAPAQARADAVRNRARLLAAARDALAEGGLDVSIDEIVRRAGFAKGTFFRHFPTKDALVRAVLADRLAQLRDVARDVNEHHPPGWAALRTTMERIVEDVAGDCSFSECLGGERGAGHDVQPALADLLTELRRTVEAAQTTGEVRPDIAASDLPVIMTAVLSATAPVHATHPHLGRRYIRLFLDGVRSGAPSDLGGPALTDEEFNSKASASDRPAGGGERA